MTMSFKIHLKRQSHGRVELCEGEAPVKAVIEAPLRIARLVALAHRIDGLVRAGELRDYAEVALVAGLTRARISQIIGLLNLSPDIQEQLLFMNRPATGREPIGEQHVRLIALEPDWKKQKRMFASVFASRMAKLTPQGDDVTN